MTERPDERPRAVTLFLTQSLSDILNTTVGPEPWPFVGLPDALSRLQGWLMDWVPGKPFSTDNYLSLQTDNTSDENCLPRFGIRPRSIESVVPGYLCTSPRQQRLATFRQRAHQ